MNSSLLTTTSSPSTPFQPAFDISKPYGTVYYDKEHAGYIGDNGKGSIVFQYAPAYLASGGPAIAHTLPLTNEPYITYNPGELPPFFDNLVAEGWLEQWQCRILGKQDASRFELLLAFGQDCAGAIFIQIANAGRFGESQHLFDSSQGKKTRLSRASLSGVQPKLATIQNKNGTYRAAETDETSTHIAKFASPAHEGIVFNEYLTTEATRALLPNDKIIKCSIDKVKSIPVPALIIPRFDRDETGGRIHFEEFNQLLGLPSRAKYDGSYKDMSDFILANDACLPTQAYILFQRILAGILLGNTDMHLKNFAMFHAGAGKTHGMQLTPGYDLVSAYLLDYKELALSLAGRSNSPIHLAEFAPRHIWRLGDYFLLPKPAITLAVHRLGKNIPAAKQALAGAKHGDNELKQQLTELMEKLWKQGFAPIGNT